MTVTIDVDRDGWTKGIQVAIGNENGGYRLAGPKYNGSSTQLGSCPVAADDAKMALACLDMPGDWTLVVEVTEAGNDYRMSLEGPQLSSAWLTDPAISAASFAVFKRVKLDSYDLTEIRRYLREVA